MDVVQITQQYISEMVKLAGPGMKVMMMDKETTGIVSCVYSQSEMMQKEVYLFERIDSGVPRESLKHLKCITFLRPTPENIQLLADELRSPKYAQYYICNKTDVKTLAVADEQETVREMHEYFADAVPLARHLLSLNIPNAYGEQFSLSMTVFRRSLDAIIAMLLAVKKTPEIRYQASSTDAKRLAEEVARSISRESTLFEGSVAEGALLIIDRNEDPVTPLLNQWTYEAMVVFICINSMFMLKRRNVVLEVHELIGIRNHRVSIDSVPGVGAIVLSPLQDLFYAKNMYVNFGEIGQNIKVLMTEYQQRAQTNQKLESISDMKAFIEQYPQFKKISGTVSKHVTVVGELSKTVAARNLLEVSETEQQIAGDGEHSQCLSAVKRLVQMNQIADIDACRLVMLYALRFEKHSGNDTELLIQLLKGRGVNNSYINAVKKVLEYAGSVRRQNNLFSGSAMTMTKRFIKGLKGVENIYTQHEPYICQLIDAVSKGRLSETTYPHVSPTAVSKSEYVIIFIIGGATYEESRAVSGFNEKFNSVQGSPLVLLVSTSMLNTQRLLVLL
uniref:Vacuolar protein sorting-associated protein 45 n=1 Tax=Syphacia muris TaxID=451379 RepID=A0A0N5AKF2_9BILA